MKGWQGLGGKLGITGHTGLLGKVGIRAGGGGSGGNLFKGTYWFSPMVNNGDDTVTDGAWIDTCLSPKNVLLTSGIETIPPQTPAIFPNHAVTRVSDELLYNDNGFFVGNLDNATFNKGIFRRANDFVIASDGPVRGKYFLLNTNDFINAVLIDDPSYTCTSIINNNKAVFSCKPEDTQESLEALFGNDGTSTNTYKITFPSSYPKDELIALRDSVGDNIREVVPVSGLLVEPEATNLAPYSEDLDNTILTRAIVTSTIVSPDGGLAHKLSANADNNTHRSDQNTGVVDGNYYYLSFFAKPNEFNCIQSSVGEFSVQTNFSSFNLSTKEVSNFGDSVGSIEEVSDGWFLCKQRVLSGAAGRISIGIGNNNSYILTGNNIDGLYVWGIECKENGFSSYIKTDGAPTTRASNVASCPTSNALIDDGFFCGDFTPLVGDFTSGINRRANDFVMAFDGANSGKYNSQATTNFVGAVLIDNPDYTCKSIINDNRCVFTCPASDTQESLEALFGNDGTSSNTYRIDFQRSGYTVAEAEQLRADVGDTPPPEVPDG